MIDTHSGRIILKNPAPALWVIALADVSGCIVSKKAFEELGDKMKTTAIGAGPYLLAEWKPNESITLRANPDYSGAAPAIKEIVLRPIQEPKTAQLAFRSDELHFTKLDDPAGADALADDPNDRHHQAAEHQLRLDRHERREEAARRCPRPAGDPQGDRRRSGRSSPATTARSRGRTR